MTDFVKFLETYYAIVIFNVRLLTLTRSGDKTNRFKYSLKHNVYMVHIIMYTHIGVLT